MTLILSMDRGSSARMANAPTDRYKLSGNEATKQLGYWPNSAF